MRKEISKLLVLIGIVAFCMVLTKSRSVVRSRLECFDRGTVPKIYRTVAIKGHWCWEALEVLCSYWSC